MASSSVRTDSNLKVVFQSAVAGLYMVAGENSAHGLQAGGYIYDRLASVFYRG